MKVLLDTCVCKKAKSQLEAAGHDVVWIAEELDCGDEEILQRAYREKRVLVTLDKDFGTLAVLYNKPHHGIIRLVNLNTNQQGLVCLQALQNNADDLLAGAIITAYENRLRKRRPKV